MGHTSPSARTGNGPRRRTANTDWPSSGSCGCVDEARPTVSVEAKRSKRFGPRRGPFPNTKAMGTKTQERASEQEQRDKWDELQTGIARGLWLVDVNDYNNVQEAVVAALDLVDTYECPGCGAVGYGVPPNCRECGSRESFIKMSGSA